MKSLMVTASQHIAPRPQTRRKPFRNAASESTVAMPRRFKVPSPSPIRLSLEALMTIASVPDARGDDRMAYAFVPFTTWRGIQSQLTSMRDAHGTATTTTHPARGRERVLLGRRWQPQFPKLARQKRGGPGLGVK